MLVAAAGHNDGVVIDPIVGEGKVVDLDSVLLVELVVLLFLGAVVKPEAESLAGR